MITEYDTVRELIPDDVQKVFEQEKENDLNAIAQIMAISKWASRFRIIPFRSLGRENGMLVGFKPDEIIIFDSDRRIRSCNIIVAIYRKNLSKDGEYGALIHPEMLKES